MGDNEPVAGPSSAPDLPPDPRHHEVFHEDGDDESIQEISQNIRSMMVELWRSWSHNEMEDNLKYSKFSKYIHMYLDIEKEMHNEFIKESRQNLRALHDQIENLKKEADELCRCLSVGVTISDYTEDMLLIDYKQELENQIAGYKEQVAQRRIRMERLFEWQHYLADKLGVNIEQLPESPLPAEEDLDRLETHLEALQAEKDRRAERVLNIEVETKNIMEKPPIRPQKLFENIVVTSLSVDFEVTDETMQRLSKFRQKLQKIYEDTNNRVLELRKNLYELWKFLKRDQVHYDNFIQAHPGCSPKTEAAIKEEIERCEQLKNEKIQLSVANVRTKIKLMWDKVMYSSREREEFVHYFQDIFTEDTLSLHEMYLEKISKYYEQHKQIFELVLTRKNLLLKMSELEARTTEPGRYKNRRGHLLQEEKDRKAISVNLAKTEAQITDLVIEFEAKTGKTITVDGKPLLHLMQDDKIPKKCSVRTSGLLASKPSTSSRSQATLPSGKRKRFE